MKPQVQAYEGYFENGRFYPTGQKISLPERQRAFVTILDEPARAASMPDTKDYANDQELRMAWLERLDKLITLSADEELIYIPRSTQMRAPVDLSE